MDSSISKQLRPQDSIQQFRSTKDSPPGHSAVSAGKGADGGGLRSPPRPKNSPPRPKRIMRRRDSAVKLARSFELEQLRLQIEELRVENKNLKTSVASQQSVLASRDQEMAAKLMAKDQEILSKRQELSAREAAVEAHRATVAAKEATIQGLTRQLEHLQDYLAVKNEVSSPPARSLEHGSTLCGEHEVLNRDLGVYVCAPVCMQSTVAMNKAKREF